MGDMPRRSFLQAALAVFPLTVIGQSSGPHAADSAVHVEAGADRFNEHLKLAGANLFACKVATRDTDGGLYIFEQTHLRKGGPPLHLHHAQEEWFYVIAGEYIAEVGKERFRLHPGDSLLAPREIPHAFARVGENAGKMIVAFEPAGQMEAFFHESAKLPDFPASPDLFRAHGMEVVGPPLSVE